MKTDASEKVPSPGVCCFMFVKSWRTFLGAGSRPLHSPGTIESLPPAPGLRLSTNRVSSPHSLQTVWEQSLGPPTVLELSRNRVSAPAPVLRLFRNMVSFPHSPQTVWEQSLGPPLNPQTVCATCSAACTFIIYL